MNKRTHKQETITIYEDNCTEDSVIFTKMESGALHIECDNPWAGDEDSGFGRTASVTLTSGQVKELLEFLTCK